MVIIIYGRSSCLYCIRAKELAEKLKNNLPFCNYKYIDIEKIKLSKESLSKKIGKPVNTVPQIFINKKHIGGYTDFYEYIKKSSLL